MGVYDLCPRTSIRLVKKNYSIHEDTLGLVTRINYNCLIQRQRQYLLQLKIY